MNNIVINKAQQCDAEFIFSCIRRLAEHVGQLEQLSATKDRIESELFSGNPNSSVLIASINNVSVGFILFFTTFSTFKGSKGFYIGDLFIVPEYRKMGVGKTLFQHVIEIAKKSDYCRVEWYVTNTNQNAIVFYDFLGAKRLLNKSLYSVDI